MIDRAPCPSAARSTLCRGAYWWPHYVAFAGGDVCVRRQHQLSGKSQGEPRCCSVGLFATPNPNGDWFQVPDALPRVHVLTCASRPCSFKCADYWKLHRYKHHVPDRRVRSHGRLWRRQVQSAKTVSFRNPLSTRFVRPCAVGPPQGRAGRGCATPDTMDCVWMFS